MNAPYPKVGIIYLTYPTAEWERDIDRCLESLEKVNYPKDRLELICVESKGKLPPVKPWFEEKWMPKSGKELPRITYIFNDEWIGFSGNNNLGYVKAKELGCDYVHLTNEDTDVDPDYILRAVECAERDPKIAYVQSLILLGDQRDKVNTSGNVFHYLGFGYSNGYRWTKDKAIAELTRERETNPELEIGYASGAGVLGRVTAIEACGGLFDEKFFSYHEDTDAAMQARIRGWKTVIEPTSIIYHYYTLVKAYQFAQNKNNYYWMERNRYVLVFSYYRLWTLFVLAPMFLVMDAAILLFSFKRGWYKNKLKIYGEWFSSEYWRWIRERRQRIQRERSISDRELLRLVWPTIDFQEENVKNPVLTHIGNPILRFYWSIARRIIA